MPTLDPGDDTVKLLTRAETGDRIAINLLFEQHRARLRRMIAVRLDHRLNRRFDPSDVVQETIAEAYRQLPKYLQSRSVGFYPWLRQIGVNRLMDLYRKHVLSGKRAIDREEHTWQLSADAVRDLTNHLVSREPNPTSRASEIEATSQLQLALKQLAPKELEIIVLRHVEQLSVAESAAVLEIASGTVKSRHFRALMRLREIMSRLDPET